MSLNARARPMSAYTTVSNQSRASRPMSAQPRKKKSQGNNRSVNGGQSIEEKLKLKFEGETNENSFLVFQHVPIGPYTIEFTGNSHYMQ